MSDSKKKFEEMGMNKDWGANRRLTHDMELAKNLMPNSATVYHKTEPVNLDGKAFELPSINEPNKKVDMENSNKKGGAKRYNKGKSRHVLLPPFAKEALADVYTRGAHKYSTYKDADGNLIQGKDIPFEKVGDYELVEDASTNWRLGEDFDSELGTYHLANAAWGLFSLLEFYKIFPEGDDRPHNYLVEKKIGLDIDEVLADWVGDWTDMEGIERPENWYFDKDLMKKFDDMKERGEMDEFYMGIRPLIKPSDIPFEPHCYITSRPVSSEVSEAWLAKHGFPARPVYTTTKERTKVVIAKEQGLDIFVDDGWHNFKALNNAGICTFLMDASHNRRYNVGHKRIKNLKDLV